MNLFPEAAEFPLVFRLNIVRAIFRVEVIGNVLRFQSRRLEFL